MQVYSKRNTSVQLTKSLFGREKVIIAVVQSKPLPGSPDYNDESMDDIYTFAVEEAKRYSIGGVHAIIVENHGDIPFLKPNDIGYETIFSRQLEALGSDIDVLIAISTSGESLSILNAISTAKKMGITTCFCS